MAENHDTRIASARHTSGPWLAAAGPSSVVGWPVVGPQGRLICNVSWFPRSTFPDASNAEYESFVAEVRANARLIAAAPDLLEVAKLGLAIAESWIRDQLDGTGNLESALRELRPIRAALSKATEGR